MGTESNVGVLSLKGDLSVNDAENIKSSMLSVLKEFPTLSISFSALEDLDCSIVQLLCAVSMLAKKQQKEVIFTGTFSPQVRKRFYAAGFISSVELNDESIITQVTNKIRNAS